MEKVWKMEYKGNLVINGMKLKIFEYGVEWKILKNMEYKKFFFHFIPL